MEELCRGGGQHLPLLPPSILHPHPKDMTGEEAEGMRASSRESSIQPIQLPHLHSV